MTALSPNLTIRWISFAEDAEQITALRRGVLVEEQGFPESLLVSPLDESGLHIGAFDGDQLVSALTVFIFNNTVEPMQSLGLPPGAGRVIQYTRRVEVPAYRGTRIAETIAYTMGRMLYEVLRPRYTFLCLQGKHIALKEHYCRAFNFEVHGSVQGPDGAEILVLYTRPGDAMRKSYTKLRKNAERLWAKLDLMPQSLVKHLESTGRMDLVPMAAINAENLYTAPLSLKDELPRLSAQTRVLFAEQKPRIEAVDFPKPPARLLDVGAGPGVYLSALGKSEKFRGYELMGLDVSKEMVMYAKLNRPDLQWLHTSAYDTKQPDQSINVVHLNFVFIHLLSPALALREFSRILRPGGLLYVVDVNDSTFEGPDEMKSLLDAHHELYEGDRSVMNQLPRLCPEWGLEPAYNFSSRIRNTGTSPEPVYLPDEVRLDRIKMWGMFSFLGQREELSEYLKVAHEFYFSSLCEISICVQTQVYRKAA